MILEDQPSLDIESTLRRLRAVFENCKPRLNIGIRPDR
jgi:hypothetical protein